MIYVKLDLMDFGRSLNFLLHRVCKNKVNNKLSAGQFDSDRQFLSPPTWATLPGKWKIY